MKPQEAELVGEISKVNKQPRPPALLRLLSLRWKFSWLILKVIVLLLTPPPLPVTLPGVGAEEGLHQCSSGAQSHPAWRHTPEGGAGGEPEELPQEGRPPGAAGGVFEGQGATATATSARAAAGRVTLITLRCRSPQEELGAMHAQLSRLDAQRRGAAREEDDAPKQRDR